MNLIKSMSLYSRNKKIEPEANKMANFQWIEVDDGDILNTDHIKFIYKYDDKNQIHLTFALENGAMVKSFDSKEEREEYLEALKEKLGVLV